MKAWIRPAVVAAVVAGTALAATLVGPQSIPPTSFAATETMASVVCPGFSSITAKVSLAAAATQSGLTSAELTKPEAKQPAADFGVLASAKSYTRLTAKLPNAFGGITSVQGKLGPDRGLSAAPCLAASTEHWFAGVDVRAEAQSEVVVVNLDQSQVSVDLAIYTKDGATAGPRGITVQPNATQAISLATVAREEDPVTVEVTSSDGRVAAFVRQRTWQGRDPLGADWMPAAVAPAESLVIPGVPAGPGQRRLIITNPGSRAASVKVGILTTAGAGEPAGANELQVPAGTTRSVDLTVPLSEQPVSVVATSGQPITAALWADLSDLPARHDPAFTAATTPISVDSVWPVAFDESVETVLQLANPSEAEQRVTVTLSTEKAPGEAKEVVLKPTSITELKLDAATANLVRLQTESESIRAALVSTGRLGKVRGLSIVDLAGGRAVTPAEVVFDPRTGS